MTVIKRTLWIGSSLNDLRDFPEEVKDEMGYALHLIQLGHTPKAAKPLKGFESAVMEIVSDYDTNAYRAVYTVKLAGVIYVLHCFQKKAKIGIKMPKQDIDLINQRLKDAKRIHEARRCLK